MIRRLGEGTVPDTCSIDISLMNMGPAVFLWSQGEVFNEYQMRAKRECTDRKVYFVAYTHGTKGYIPTADAFLHKGYEVDQAYVYLDEPSPLTPDTDHIYMSALRDLLRESS